jgi:hypothetical protein
MEMYTPSTLDRRWAVTPPEHIRAWRLSPAEATMAIGLLNGQIGLIDVDSGSVRWVSSPYQSSPVNEFEYSRDSRWVAAIHENLALQLIDVSTGAIVMPGLSHIARRGMDVLDLDPSLRRIAIQDGSQCLIFDIGDNGATELLHSVPGEGPNRVCGVSLRQSLAVAVADGEATLWRFGTQQPLRGRAPNLEMLQAATSLPAERILDVGERTVQLLDLAGEAQSAPMRFPQAIGFALDLGETVLVSAAQSLHLRQSADGDPRYPPIELPANPAALLANRDTALAAWVVHEAGLPQVRIASIDLAQGRVIGERTLPSFRPQLALSDDGRHVLAWYDDGLTRESELLVMHRDGLSDAWKPPQKQSAPEANLVRYAALGSNRLWRMRGLGGDQGYWLEAFALDSGELLQSWPLETPFMAAGVSGQRLIAVNQSNQVLIYEVGKTPIVWTHRLPQREGHHGFALSADGTRIVVFRGNAAQWLDLRSGRWLVPPLIVPEVGMFVRIAIVGDLAVISDDKRRQWSYPLQRTNADIASLQRQLQALLPGDGPRLTDDGETVRRALRAADPGPPAPLPTVSAALPEPISPPFVDLRPRCNLPLERTGKQLHMAIRLDRALTIGRQRLLGQDYEVRCGVFPTFVPDRDANVADGSRIEGIDLGGQRAAAIDLLMVAPSIIIDRIDPQFAVLEIAYANGQRTRRTLMLGDDLRPWLQPYYSERPNRQRMAWIGLSAQFFESVHPRAPKPAAYHVRLDNPHPDWPMASLAIESTRRPYSAPLLLAATLAAADGDKP